MSGTVFGSGRTGAGKTQPPPPPPIKNLEEDQGQEGSNYKVLVIGDAGDSSELGKQGGQRIFGRPGTVSKKKSELSWEG